MDLKLCTASKGKKKCFQFFKPPYAPTSSTPKQQPQNVGNQLFIKDIGPTWSFTLGPYVNDILNDHCHFCGGVIFAQHATH